VTYHEPLPLKCSGVSRDSENLKSIVVSFSRRLTDDELRFFHDVCGRTAPLMDERP
jgi:hypothetical protein